MFTSEFGDAIVVSALFYKLINQLTRKGIEVVSVDNRHRVLMNTLFQCLSGCATEAQLVVDLPTLLREKGVFVSDVGNLSKLEVMGFPRGYNGIRVEGQKVLTLTAFAYGVVSVRQEVDTSIWRNIGFLMPGHAGCYYKTDFLTNITRAGYKPPTLVISVPKSSEAFLIFSGNRSREEEQEFSIRDPQGVVSWLEGWFTPNGSV